MSAHVRSLLPAWLVSTGKCVLKSARKILRKESVCVAVSVCGHARLHGQLMAAGGCLPRVPRPDTPRMSRLSTVCA